MERRSVVIGALSLGVILSSVQSGVTFADVAPPTCDVQKATTTVDLFKREASVSVPCGNGAWVATDVVTFRYAGETKQGKNVGVDWSPSQRGATFALKVMPDREIYKNIDITNETTGMTGSATVQVRRISMNDARLDVWRSGSSGIKGRVSITRQDDQLPLQSYTVSTKGKSGKLTAKSFDGSFSFAEVARGSRKVTVTAEDALGAVPGSKSAEVTIPRPYGRPVIERLYTVATICNDEILPSRSTDISVYRWRAKRAPKSSYARTHAKKQFRVSLNGRVLTRTRSNYFVQKQLSGVVTVSMRVRNAGGWSSWSAPKSSVIKTVYRCK